MRRDRIGVHWLGMQFPSHEQVLEILDAGIRAPSADNRHRIWFETLRDGLRIGADADFLRCSERHRTILTLIGVGAVVENILVRASALGFVGSVQFAADWRSTAVLADVTWTNSTQESDPLAEAIGSRHTNRRFFHGPPVGPEHRRLLDAEIAKMHPAQLLWIDGARRAAVLRLVREAESARFEHQALHEELFNAIRFDVGWRLTCDEGLPPGSLEIEPFLRKPFSLLRHWRVMRGLKAIGFHQLLGVRAGYLPCRLSHDIGVIALAGDPEAGAPVAGRGFQRVWLQATRLGLVLQPLAAAAVLVWGPEPALARTLKENWANITPGVTPLLLFRLGRARAASVVTNRRPAETYLRPPTVAS